MSYAAALEYLRDFPDWERGTAGSAETYTLERMRRLLDLLGHPDRAFPIVHVVGTKGKGSTAAMIASCLRAAGYRTGLFTSPHLVDYRERVRVDGAPVSPEALAAIVDERLRPVVEALERAGERVPLHFELLCALAFEHFRREAVDVAVVEAGLGGRLDATNAVTDTLLTVIATIGYDHMAVLGRTLAAIAGEKAAVVRPGGQVVSAPQQPEAMAVIEAVCCERAAQLVEVGHAWTVHDVVERPGETLFDVRGPGASYDRLRVPLAGAHQATNAALAVAALALLRARFPRTDEPAIRHGLSAVRWPGRLQMVGHGPSILLDGAHNAESSLALSAALRRIYPGDTFVLIVAMFADKDASAILTPLAPLVGHAIAVQTGHPRALPAESLAEAVRALGMGVEGAPSLTAALDRARALAGPAGRVLVTGSLHLVGEALRALGIDTLDG